MLPFVYAKGKGRRNKDMQEHQTLAWRKGRLSHKVMCPFSKRYRLVAKAKNSIDTESYEDICKDIFETVCVLKYEV